MPLGVKLLGLSPPGLAWRLAQAIGEDAHVTIIPKAGHGSNLECRPAFSCRLLVFLADGREEMSP